MAQSPTLLDEGTGILKTHVSWQIIEQTLQKSLATAAVFGDAKSARNIADGVGFASIVALVEPDWQNAQPSEALPSKVIVKLPTLINTHKIAESLRQDLKEKGTEEHNNDTIEDWLKILPQMHNAEVSFYDFIKHKNGNFDELKLAHVYGGKKFDGPDDVVGYLIMEFVQDFHTAHIFEALSVDQVAEALKAWAKLQAFCYETEFLTDPAILVDNYRAMYEALMPPAETIAFLEQVKRNFPGLNELVDEVIKVAPLVSNFDFIDGECARRNMSPVLAHGDLWITNVMWDATARHLKTIIDFQLIHVGSPAGDVARLLVTAMSGKERRENEEQLLEIFYNEFAHCLGDKRKPYSLAQLKANYHALLPWAALECTAMFGPVAHYALLKAGNDEAQDQLRVVASEKAKAAYEDLLKEFSNLE